ncbi:MAG: hypothetical protein HYT69_01835 [Candidatus Zambryskibacteria bacterium]|nr:hypothetical protein [Candidatus Zambryskibacteria bacterium]
MTLRLLGAEGGVVSTGSVLVLVDVGAEAVLVAAVVEEPEVVDCTEVVVC